MERPLVTTIDGAPAAGGSGPADPTVVILFNDRSGPGQVVDIVANKHAFVDSEIWETEDEQSRPAWLLVLRCETATADQLFDLIGSRLPDYIQPRRFPPSRLAAVRSSGTRVA